MPSFANKLEKLVQRVELDSSEFTRLVYKHNLEGFSGPSEVVFAHGHKEERVTISQRHNISLDNFRVVVSNEMGCFDCSNSYAANDNLAENDYWPKAA